VAGYSGTPLAAKLGVKEGMTIHAAGAPDDFATLLEPLPPGVAWKRQLRAPVDLAVAFFTGAREVERAWPRLTAAVGDEGTVWVAWPKRSSGVPTDLTEQTFRGLLLPTGWVDVKVCAIDDTWSGLKFVLRRERRGRPT
jgi:hypothetical protein